MIVTFGYGQTHPLTGAPLDNCYTRVPGQTHADVRDAMAASVFGRQYAFIYETEDGPRGAGVTEFRMREVPFIPPSPVGLFLANLVPNVDLAPSVWTDMVVQPAEIAHHRAIEALRVGRRK